MRKIHFLLVLFLTGFVLEVQGQLYVLSGNDNRNSITIAPFNVLDFINPSLQIGYERMLNSKFAIQIEGAYILNHSFQGYLMDKAYDNTDCILTNKGYKIRGEFKYYFSHWQNSKPYISCELFYLKNRSGEIERFMSSENTFANQSAEFHSVGYYDEFINDKQRMGLNFKCGLKVFLDHHFFIETHIGLGIVYRKIKHYDRLNINDEFAYKLFNYDKVLGNMWVLNLPYNMKIGYRF